MAGSHLDSRDRPVSDGSDDAAVAGALSRHYGLTGRLSPIATEKDDTYKLTCAGANYLVKVAAEDESSEVVDLQIAVMRHLERTAPTLPVQRVLSSVTGPSQVPLTSEGHAGPRSLRVMAFVEGSLLADATPTRQLISAVGRGHASMTRALADFTHPAQDRAVVWDLQGFTRMRRLVDDLPLSPEQVDLATAVFDRFDRDVQPLVDTLDRQVVHGDVSPFNVVVSDTEPRKVNGYIDFGDSNRSATIFDLSIPLANLLTGDAEDPWQRTYAYVEGYASERAIPAHELALLVTTAPARLLLRALLSALSAARDHPSRRDYLSSHGTNDWNNVKAAWTTPVDLVTARLEAAAHGNLEQHW